MKRLVAVAAVVLYAGIALAGNCTHCKLPFDGGALTCSGCGSHLPGAAMPSDIVKLDLTPILIEVDESAVKESADAVPPEVAFEQINSWIRDNPKKHDEAIRRLEEFMTKINGTGLETTVMVRITQIRGLKAKANKPKSPQERLREAAREYTKVMGTIGKEPSRTINNIRLLENLLKTAKGTPYEKLVKKQLEIQRAKASMR